MDQPALVESGTHIRDPTVPADAKDAHLGCSMLRTTPQLWISSALTRAPGFNSKGLGAAVIVRRPCTIGDVMQVPVLFNISPQNFAGGDSMSIEYLVLLDIRTLRASVDEENHVRAVLIFERPWQMLTLEVSSRQSFNQASIIP